MEPGDSEESVKDEIFNPTLPISLYIPFVDFLAILNPSSFVELSVHVNKDFVLEIISDFKFDGANGGLIESFLHWKKEKIIKNIAKEVVIDKNWFLQNKIINN